MAVHVSAREVEDSYRQLLARAESHFRRVAETQPESLSCRRGCTLCCVGLFEISAADVATLVEALDRVPASLRDDLVRRSREIIVETEHPDLRSVNAVERERFFERAAEVACPALGPDGECRIYSDRPLVCRTFGLPLRDGANHLGEECELNFVSASREERESAAWNLQSEDVLGPEDQYSIPEAILLAERLRDARQRVPPDNP